VAYINAQNTGTVTQVSAGVYHSCAVTTGNAVYCWGANTSGQLGNGSDDTQSSVPVQVKAGAQGDGYLSGVESVSAGGNHSCAVTTGNTVYCWGYNAYGQLGKGRPLDNSSVPVQVCAAGAPTDGTCGNQFLLNVKQISAGGDQTCAVTTEGYAYCWGYNFYGQLGNNDRNLSSVPVAVADANDFENGSVRSVSAGELHSCAVTTEKEVYCWGNNGARQLGVPISIPLWSKVPVKVSSNGGFGGL